jgi:HPt (histidine-containing phosphotransfer) domain-containing protein
MSFGFSVGDFIAVGKLISDITSSLQTIGGAKSEYQELIREFNSLSAALRYLDQLQNKTSTPSKLLDSIKCAALSCRYPLEAFLSKIKKYEASLSPWNQFRTGKTVADKLVEHGLERMDMYEKRAEEDASQIRQQLDDANTALKDVAKTSAGEAVILRTMHSMLGNLWKVVCGEVKTSLQQVSQVVNKVW